MSDTPRRVIEVADGFWNIRGSFKLGLIDIGTQASLVRLANGKFAFLDACKFSDETRDWIAELTGGGADVESILHLHPFHTVFVKAHHDLYPEAKLYGTSRHHEQLADLPWQPLKTEDPELHQAFAGDFEFSIPDGVDFISANPKLHFSSVLAFHPASKTLHVDDTVLFIELPPVIRWFAKDLTRFHMTLAKTLEPRAGAAGELRAWAEGLIERAADLENLCAAHSAVLLGRDNKGASIADRLKKALARVEKKLAAHERRYAD